MSEHEANDRGIALIGKKLHHFFLPNVKNCGYVRMEDLGCAVDSRGIVVMLEWEI